MFLANERVSKTKTTYRFEKKARQKGNIALNTERTFLYDLWRTGIGIAQHHNTRGSVLATHWHIALAFLQGHKAGLGRDQPRRIGHTEGGGLLDLLGLSVHHHGFLLRRTKMSSQLTFNEGKLKKVCEIVKT